MPRQTSEQKKAREYRAQLAAAAKLNDAVAKSRKASKALAGLGKREQNRVAKYIAQNMGDIIQAATANPVPETPPAEEPKKTYTFWSDHEKNLLIMNYDTLTREELMKLLPGRTWDAILTQRQALGLKQQNSGRHGRVAPKMQFTRLTVRERVRKENGRPAWLCDCECGGTIIATTSSLLQGHTKSCGCLSADNLKAYNRTKKATEDRKRNWASKKLELGYCGGTWVKKMLNNKPNKRNTTGINGVVLRPNGRYEAHVRFKGQYYYLGRFPTIEEAAEARAEKLKEIAPELEELQEIIQLQLAQHKKAKEAAKQK